MDWRTDGPISKQKKPVIFYYNNRHNGECLKNGQNDEYNKTALAFDTELKGIDTKLILLNSKKLKTKDDQKIIADLTKRRAICFEKGKNSMTTKAAQDARANGLCPGAMNNGCSKNNPQVLGFSYCSTCQVIVNIHNSKPEVHASVVRAREKRGG